MAVITHYTSYLASISLSVSAISFTMCANVLKSQFSFPLDSSQCLYKHRVANMIVAIVPLHLSLFSSGHTLSNSLDINPKFSAMVNGSLFVELLSIDKQSAL
ncbi:hypothetical protein BC943DRAFT_318761 [Umbelopsis sp. AD052]|nr:hypothetical protein BC943DRAFT_318761 [Umbelopsis sp. AD052]